MTDLESDKRDETTKSSSRCTSMTKLITVRQLVMLLGGLFALGLLLFCLGFLVVTSTGYVCGGDPPSAEELQALGNPPVCLTVSVRSNAGAGPMCLQPGRSPDQPSLWCQERLASKDIVGPSSYYLWWVSDACCTFGDTNTSTTDYGSGYILGPDTTTFSDYELLVSRESPPLSNEAPPSSSSDWKYYDSDSNDWTSETIDIDSCPITDQGDVNEDGIPSACFAEQETLPALYWTGIAMMSLGMLGLFTVCFMTGNCKAERRGIQRPAHLGGHGV